MSTSRHVHVHTPGLITLLQQVTCWSILKLSTVTRFQVLWSCSDFHIFVFKKYFWVFLFFFYVIGTFFVIINFTFLCWTHELIFEPIFKIIPSHPCTFLSLVQHWEGFNVLKYCSFLLFQITTSLSGCEPQACAHTSPVVLYLLTLKPDADIY